MLCLRGISTKDFEPALAEFFGSEAGLSASTIQRLTREWGEHLAAFQQRDLNQVDYVYLWADGVHFNILEFAIIVLFLVEVLLALPHVSLS